MKHSNRIWEIDFVRGIAIILMVFFHAIVDLKDFFGYGLNYLSGPWYYEGKISAILFIVVAGTSTTLGRNQFKHGFKIFLWGMVLTAVTYVYDPATYIRFGILHFLGASIMLSPYVAPLPPLALVGLSGVCLLIGNVLLTLTVTSPLLFPVGLLRADFLSMDYYPLLPWYSIFLLGQVIGKTVYSARRSLYPPHYTAFSAPIASLGRHSLIIYLMHQPLLLTFLYLLHH